MAPPSPTPESNPKTGGEKGWLIGVYAGIVWVTPLSGVHLKLVYSFFVVSLV